MVFCIDIDGTLTEQQRRGWWRRRPHALRDDVLAKVRALVAAGHEVVVWSSSTAYAQSFVDHAGLEGVIALGKPGVIVDNQRHRWANRLRGRVITPEQFLARDYEGGDG